MITFGVYPKGVSPYQAKVIFGHGRLYAQVWRAWMRVIYNEET